MNDCIYSPIYTPPGMHTNSANIFFNAEITDFITRANADLGDLRDIIEPPKTEVEQPQLQPSRVKYIYDYSSPAPSFWGPYPSFWGGYNPTYVTVVNNPPPATSSPTNSGNDKNEQLSNAVRLVAGFVATVAFFLASYKLGAEWTKRSMAQHAIDENRKFVKAFEEDDKRYQQQMSSSIPRGYTLQYDVDYANQCKAILKVTQCREEIFAKLSWDASFRLACWVALAAGAVFALAGAVVTSATTLVLGGGLCVGAIGARLVKLGAESIKDPYKRLRDELFMSLDKLKNVMVNKSYLKPPEHYQQQPYYYPHQAGQAPAYGAGAPPIYATSSPYGVPSAPQW